VFAHVALLFWGIEMQSDEEIRFERMLKALDRIDRSIATLGAIVTFLLVLILFIK
jgi:hypothetical protein